MNQFFIWQSLATWSVATTVIINPSKPSMNQIKQLINPNEPTNQSAKCIRRITKPGPPPPHHATANVSPVPQHSGLPRHRKPPIRRGQGFVGANPACPPHPRTARTRLARARRRWRQQESAARACCYRDGFFFAAVRGHSRLLEDGGV